MNDIVFLRLLQIFDSQFPVGAFAHSGGLETYGQMGAASPELADLLRHQIELGWGRLDMAGAALAWGRTQTPDALEDLGRQMDAWKTIPSVRLSSIRLGRRTLSLTRRLFPNETLLQDLSRPHQCIVVGALGKRFDTPVRQLLLAFGQSTLMASLTGAMRCMPVSPGQAQEVLVALQPALSRTVDEVLKDPSDSLYACTPGLDIRCHQQASLATRLFQS